MATHATYLSTEYLKECFSYDQESGILTWRERPREHFNTDRGYNIFNARFSGAVAGSPHGNGYLRIGINGSHYYVHRVAWKMETGNWPAAEIDHVNGNRADNRMSNLREVSHSENGRNSSIAKSNTSGTTGVSWHPSLNKWRARIKACGKEIHLGYFTHKTDAMAARKTADSKHGYHKNHGRAKVTQ